jgi:hypothetical protein
MPVVHFTSSDSFMELDNRAALTADVEVVDYVEATYCALRTGPDGVTIAVYEGGAWELPDGRRFSDWAVRV